MDKVFCGPPPTLKAWPNGKSFNLGINKKSSMRSETYKMSLTCFPNNSAKPIIYSGLVTKNVTGRVDSLEKFREVDSDTILVETTKPELKNSELKPCKIDILSRSSVFFSAELRCTTAAIIVLNEYFDGNWKSYLNENKVDVFKSNLNQNGVFVPVGVHKLEFKYQPTDFFVGTLISALSSFLLALYFLGRRFMGKRAHKELAPNIKFWKRVFNFVAGRYRKFR